MQIGIEEEIAKISTEEKERKSYLMLIDTYLIFNVLIKRYKYKNEKNHNYKKLTFFWIIIYIYFKDTMITRIIL